MLSNNRQENRLQRGSYVQDFLVFNVREVFLNEHSINDRASTMSTTTTAPEDAGSARYNAML